MINLNQLEEKTHNRVLELVKQDEEENNKRNKCNEKYSKRDVNCIELGYVKCMCDCQERLIKIMSEKGFDNSFTREVLENMF